MDVSSAPQAAPSSLWRLPAMRLLAAYTLFGFTGFFATMSALPAWIAAQGTAESLAGLVTTTLLVATVSTQTMVPRMIQRLGLATTLAVGLVALGAPSLLFLIDGGYWWVLVICAVRGIGFGILTVVGSMLTARIVTPARRGEAVGIYGLAIAVPNLLAVAGGVALVTAGHFEIVAILGAAPLLGLFAVRSLARAAGSEEDTPAGRRPRTGSSTGGEAGGLSGGAAGDTAGDTADDTAGDTAGGAAGDAAGDTAGVRAASADSSRAARRVARRAAIGPAAILMVVTLASGGFMTYLPIERPDGALATIALLLWGATGAFARWRVGLLADKSGLTVLLPVSSVVSVVGIVAVPVGLVLGGGISWAVVLVGSAVLGAGYGATQNLTLVAAFAQARQRETATVSSVWNVGFDTGTALGSGVVGAMTAIMSIPLAIALPAILVAASVPLAIRKGRPPASV